MMYIIVVIAFLDMFAQFPIMSPFAESLGAGPVMIGWVVGGYSLFNLIGNIIAGKWIDHYGAKKILVAGMLMTGILVGIYSVITTPSQLLIVRLIHGLVSGALAPSVFTWISQRTNGAAGRYQGRNMAFSGAAVGISAVLGPALSGILRGTLGVNSVFYMLAILMLLGALSIHFLIKYEPVKAQQASDREEKSLKEWLPILINRGAFQSYLGAFSLMNAMGVLTYMLPLKAERLGFDGQAGGLMISTFGVVAVIFFLLPTNRWFDRLRLNLMMLTGFLLLTAALFMLSVFAQEMLLYFAMGVYGLGFAFIFPSITKNLVESVPDQDRGKAFGVFYAVYSIGVVTGSVGIGLLSVTLDEGFFVTALFLVVMTAIIYFSGRSRGRADNRPGNRSHS